MPETKEVEKTEELTEKVEKKETKQETPTVKELLTKLDKAQRTIVNKTEEAERVHTKLEKFEKDEEARKKENMTELEKLQANLIEKDGELSTVQSKVKELETNNEKRKIAEEVGLPVAFALRIQGATPEEMKADAETLLGAMPAKPGKSGITNPSKKSAFEIKETDDDKRRRLGIGISAFTNKR